MEEFNGYLILNKPALLFVKPGNLNSKSFFEFKQFNYIKHPDISKRAVEDLQFLNDVWNDNNYWIEEEIDLTRYSYQECLDYIHDVYETWDELIYRNEDNSEVELARLIFENTYLSNEESS